jgi:hypothetical protein
MPDSDEVRVVAGSPRPIRTNITVGSASAVLLALIVGVVVGRITAPEHSSKQPASQASDPGPFRSSSGVPVGYAHTQPGAVAAALNYGVVSARPEFLDAARRTATLRIIATPAFARTFETKAAPGLAAALRGPLGQGLRAGTPTIYQSAPLAYRVVSYTPQRAVITGWGLALSGNTGGLAPQVDFQTATSTLVWSEDDWKLADGASVEGPTPALAQDAHPTSAAQFVRQLQTLRGVRNAP